MKVLVSTSAVPSKLKDDKKYAQLLAKVAKSKDKVSDAKLKLKEAEKELAADIKEADKYKVSVTGKPKPKLPKVGNTYVMQRLAQIGTDKAKPAWKPVATVQIVSVDQKEIKFKRPPSTSVYSVNTKDLGKTVKFQ